MLSGLAATLLPKSLLLQQTLENEPYLVSRASSPDCVFRPSGSSVDSNLLANWLAMILISLASGTSLILQQHSLQEECLDFLITVITGESCLISFSVTCPFSQIKKLSYWSREADQLFVPPRHCPQSLNHPGWTVLMVGREDALLQHVNSQLSISHQLQLLVQPIDLPLGLPDRIPKWFAWGCNIWAW